MYGHKLEQNITKVLGLDGIRSSIERMQLYTGFNQDEFREFFKYLYGNCNKKELWKYRKCIKRSILDLNKQSKDWNSITVRPFSYYAIRFKLKGIDYNTVRKMAFDIMDNVIDFEKHGTDSKN